jgi:hypothetical protein
VVSGVDPDHRSVHAQCIRHRLEVLGIRNTNSLAFGHSLAAFFSEQDDLEPAGVQFPLLAREQILAIRVIPCLGRDVSAGERHSGRLERRHGAGAG